MTFNEYSEEIINYLYTNMDERTHGILFGSIITNDWVESRSDIDLVIMVL